MRKLFIIIGLLALSFGLMAQEKQQGTETGEVLAIGALKMHTEDDTLKATVYDTRTAELYKFALPNGNDCGQLVEDKQYEFRLLVTCASLECEELNFTLIDFEKTVNQTRIDVGKLREGTKNKYSPEDLITNK